MGCELDVEPQIVTARGGDTIVLRSLIAYTHFLVVFSCTVVVCRPETPCMGYYMGDLGSTYVDPKHRVWVIILGSFYL